MFWLLPHPFPLLLAVSTTATHRKTEKVRQLADIRGGGGGVGAKSFDARKPGPLKSFNTLWLPLPAIN
jgi:hypothetical protein